MRLSQIFRIKWWVFIRVYIRNLNLRGPPMKFLNIRLLLGIKLFGRWRQVVWGFGGVGFLTKLCLGSGYGALGRKLPIYGVRL